MSDLSLDLKCTQLAVKNKHFVIIDLSFPQPYFFEFRKNYPHRYVHLPAAVNVAFNYAQGFALFGAAVLLYGLASADTNSFMKFDNGLNVKCLLPSNVTSWEEFEDGIKSFGSAALAFPQILNEAKLDEDLT